MNEFTYLERDNRQFEKGRRYIGASDWPTLFLLNKHRGQTPLTFWEVFTGRRDGFRGNRRTAAGNRHEPGILAEYVRAHTDRSHVGYLISRLRDQNEYEGLHSFSEFHAPEYPHIVSHPDLIDMTADTPVLVQAKNTGFFAGRRMENKNKGYDTDDLTENGVPLAVYYQEQCELYTSNLNEAYVAVEIEGWDWRLYGPIRRNKKVIEAGLALSERMWWHISHDTPPKPETWSDVVSLFPELQEGTAAIVGGQDYSDLLQIREELKQINREMERLKENRMDRTNAVGLMIGGSQILRDAEGNEYAKAWEKQGQWRADLKKLQADHPGIYGRLVDDGIIRQDKVTRQLSISGTLASYSKCKQCGKFAGDKPYIARAGRRILFGPFCSSCWSRIKKTGGD